jgi:IclR family acetate operon transcriptional repressor
LYFTGKIPGKNLSFPVGTAIMSESIRAVDRALDILLCFTIQTPQLTMTQIAEQVGMNKSTVHRLLGTLERRRFVQRNPTTGSYQLGIRLLQMAYLTLEHNDIRRYAGPYLRRLCEQHRETITFSTLDDADVVFLDVIESPQRVKLAASTGQRMPAFSTAAGKAILAHLPNEMVMRILERGMPQFTQSTILSKETLLVNLELIRQQGFAISLQEYEDGINAVAAPVLNTDGFPIAAITVAGPAYRLTKELMLEIGPSVLETSRMIAQEIEFARGSEINTPFNNHNP